MSHVMRKPVYALGEQERRRSACPSAESDQHLLVADSKTAATASFCSWAGGFVSYLAAKAQDWFSHDVAHVTVESCKYWIAGQLNSKGSVSAWHWNGPEFDPHVRHILLWRLGHENISMAILPLPLIQEKQLSVTGERMCIKHWLAA